MEERVRHVVVSDENVNEAVPIVVVETHAHAFAEFLGDSGLVGNVGESAVTVVAIQRGRERFVKLRVAVDRKSTRLNSSHVEISYAVFCLKKKKSNII